MQLKVWMVGIMLGAAWIAPGSAFANDSKPQIKADTKAEFGDVVAAVQGEMVPGGRYEFVDSSERRTIDANLAEMRSLFDQFGTVSAMDKDAKFKLYVDQENVNAILTRRDDRRMICTSERPMGSLIPKRTCRTYGAIQRDRKNSQEFMQQQARPGFVSGGYAPGGH
ncbi:MAG TPA: hypothetical protein VN043_08525 [Rhodanobacter sp.]|nr:hypothetical protein [Rhodanobacter sp.]